MRLSPCLGLLLGLCPRLASSQSLERGPPRNSMVWSGNYEKPGRTPATTKYDGACVEDAAAGTVPPSCPAHMECEKWGIKALECRDMCSRHRECHAFEHGVVDSVHGYERCKLLLVPVASIRRVAGHVCEAKEMVEHVLAPVPKSSTAAVPEPRPPWTGSCNGVATLPPANPDSSYFRVTPCVAMAGPNVDFSSLGCEDLAYTDLRGANLQGAILQGADLCGAHLDFANLREADFQGAKMEGVSLRNAATEGARFEHVELPYADLTNTDLRGSNMAHIRAPGAVFQHAKLNYADLREADLKYADMRSTSIAGTILEQAELQGTDFTGAIGVAAAALLNAGGTPIGMNVGGPQQQNNWGGPGSVPPQWGAFAPSAHPIG